LTPDGRHCAVAGLTSIDPSPRRTKKKPR